MHVGDAGLGARLFDLGQQVAGHTHLGGGRLPRQGEQLRAGGLDREDVVGLAVHGYAECCEIITVPVESGDRPDPHRLEAPAAEADRSPHRVRCQLPTQRGDVEPGRRCGEQRAHPTSQSADAGVLFEQSGSHVGLGHREHLAKPTVELPGDLPVEAGGADFSVGAM